MKIRPFASFLLAAAAFAPALRAQSVSPVPAPTIITSAPYTITTPGYYQLGANLSYNGNGTSNDAIITVNASNVTIDLAGHYLSGPVNAATALYGIYASERANLIIQNGTIAHCDVGVLLTGNGTTTSNNRNATLSNLTITVCYSTGIYLTGVTGGQVTGCQMSGLGGGTAGVFPGYTIGVYTTSSTTGINVAGNTFSSFTSATQSWGILNYAQHTLTATNNVISDINLGGGTSVGIEKATFAADNNISAAVNGVLNCLKYKGNLTSGVTTPFSGGTAVGSENN